MSEDPSLAQLADVIRELADRAEILELSARYNRAADNTDVAALLSVFTPDAVMVMHGRPEGPATFSGHAEIAGLVAPFAGQRVHSTTNHIVEIRGDRASQFSSLLLCTRSPSKGVGAVFTGTYEDELVRTATGWQFSSRVVHVDYANEARMPLAGTTEAS